MPAAPSENGAVEILYPPRFEKWWALLICLVFVAIGIWMVSTGAGWPGWLALGFFGLCAVSCVLADIFRDRFALELTQDGFTVRSPFASSYVAWRDVEAFEVWRHRGNRLVGWRLVEKARADKGLATTTSRAISGLDGALSSSFGMKTAELVALLEDRRRRALGRES